MGSSKGSGVSRPRARRPAMISWPARTYSGLVEGGDPARSVAGAADLLHGRAAGRRVRALLGDGGVQEPRQALGRVVGHTRALEPAHVAGRTRRRRHVADGQLVGGRVEVHLIDEGDIARPVLGFRPDLDLGVIGSQVTLATGGRLTRQRQRGAVGGVALDASSDGPVGVGGSDVVASLTANLLRRRTFEQRKGVRGSLDGPGVEGLGVRDLLGSEVAGSVHRRPGRRRVAAAQELRILLSVALGAVSAGHVFGQGEATVLPRCLPLGGSMALETGHASPSVRASLVEVHHAGSLAPMARRTITHRLDELTPTLVEVAVGPGTVEEKGRDDEGCAQGDGDEDGDEGRRPIRQPRGRSFGHELPLYSGTTKRSRLLTQSQTKTGNAIRAQGESREAARRGTLTSRG